MLSNIMFNELDKELEARGLRYTRYADDCVIAVKSESSAKRVMGTVSDWIQRKLGLKVNMTKTRITRPMKLKYLGFGFYKDSRTKEWKCRPHQESVKKFKDRLKGLTGRKTVKSFSKAPMGIAEAGNRKMPFKADSVLWIPLLLDSNQNMRCQGNLKRRTDQCRAYKLP